MSWSDKQTRSEIATGNQNIAWEEIEKCLMTCIDRSCSLRHRLAQLPNSNSMGHEIEFEFEFEFRKNIEFEFESAALPLANEKKQKCS